MMEQLKDRSPATYVALLVDGLRTCMKDLSSRLVLIEQAVEGSPTDIDAAKALNAYRQLSLLQDALLAELVKASSTETTHGEVKHFSLLSLLNSVRAIVEKARLGSEIEIELPRKDLRLHTNPSTVHRILHNLVLNAIQHSHGMHVRIEAEAQFPNLVLRVIDDGRGLPGTRLSDAAGFLRELEIRAATDEALAKSGLWTSMLLAKDLGGHLDVESSSKSGTAWRLVVPKGVATTRSELYRVFRSDELARKVIAILDDDVGGSDVLADKFAALGANVITENNEVDFLRRVHAARPRPNLYVLNYLVGPPDSFPRLLDSLQTVPEALSRTVVVTPHLRDTFLTDARDRVAGVVGRPLDDHQFRVLVNSVAGRTLSLRRALTAKQGGEGSAAVLA